MDQLIQQDPVEEGDDLDRMSTGALTTGRGEHRLPELDEPLPGFPEAAVELVPAGRLEEELVAGDEQRPRARLEDALGAGQEELGGVGPGQSRAPQDFRIAAGRQVQLNVPSQRGLQQGRSGAEVIRGRAGGQAGDLIDGPVREPARAALGEHRERRVGCLLAAAR